VILLGDGAVGKTSIANRFTEDRFAQSYKQTVGVDFFVRRLQLSRQFLLFPSLSFSLIQFLSNTHRHITNLGYWWAIYWKQNDYKLCFWGSCLFRWSLLIFYAPSLPPPRQAVLFCYDITNAESFANLEDWYRVASRTFDEDFPPFTVLVGNKSQCPMLYLSSPHTPPVLLL
jgi:Ras-related protein Rab-28